MLNGFVAPLLTIIGRRTRASSTAIKKKRLIYPFKYILLAILMLFVANIAIRAAIQYLTIAQTACMTRTQVANDTRCLYIYNQSVFKKGSRTSSHQGHPCGIDVTAFIPSFHYLDTTKYMTPNYIANLCPDTTPTPLPSGLPSPTPTASPAFTLSNLVNALKTYLSPGDAGYFPVDGKINLWDSAYIIKHITP